MSATAEPRAGQTDEMDDRVRVPKPDVSWAQSVGEESRKSLARWLKNSFYETYLSGQNILDIGYRGYLPDVKPIVPQAIGVDVDYPGYDGRTLPFPDELQNCVFASHTLEHIDDHKAAIREWFRVLRSGGYLIIIVPHWCLYERKGRLPSNHNADHRRFYTGAKLLREIERAVDPFSFRIRMLEDNDREFDYSIPPADHATGSYELICVIEKISKPSYADDVLELAGVDASAFQPLTKTALFDRLRAAGQILDIGHKRYERGVTSLLPQATLVGLEFPADEKKALPFGEQSQDAVFSSYVLQHVVNYRSAIADWFRLVRVGGFLIVNVPHQFLYERKLSLPSRFDASHKRFYTAASLLMEIEEALDPHGYRVRYLEDNDAGFDYGVRPQEPSSGGNNIIVVLERIRRPDYADAVLEDKQIPGIDGEPRRRVALKPGASDGPTVTIRSAPGPVGKIAVMKLDTAATSCWRSPPSSSCADISRWRQ